MQDMRRILVTGALGQIGSELCSSLREHYGDGQVIASDLRMMPYQRLTEGIYQQLDCTQAQQILEVIRRHDIGTIYHLAALLSAVAEEKPHAAWSINMGGLYNVLEAARQYRCQVFFPSSIGAFGPSTPREHTPQVTIQRPSTMYGVTKVAGELLVRLLRRAFRRRYAGAQIAGAHLVCCPARWRDHRLCSRNLLPGSALQALHLLSRARYAPRYDVHAGCDSLR